MEEQVSSPLRDLMTEVANRQKDIFERESTLSQLRVRPPLRIVRPRRRARPTWFLLPVLGAAAAAAAIVGVIWRTAPTAPITFAIGDAASDSTEAAAAASSSVVGRAGEIVAARDRAVALRFSDGSSVQLTAGSEARVAELDGRGARLHIETGRADVDVKHRAQTKWSLQAGPFEVRVTGTRFSIGWDKLHEAVTVAMAEGSVEISSRDLPGSAPVRVTAGQRFSASKGHARWTIDPVGPDVASVTVPGSGSGAAVAAAVTNESAPGVAPGPATEPQAGDATADGDGANVGPVPSRAARMFAVGQRQWQVLARRGRYQDALDLVERTGGFAATSRRLGSEELVQLGDVARLAGNVARAEQAYKLARKRFPRIDRPTFGLGLVAFEQRQDYVAAARWFEAYRQRFPSGPLRNEALGRAMESWHRAGDRRRAGDAARDYLERSPSGPYAPLARQIANP